MRSTRAAIPILLLGAAMLAGCALFRKAGSINAGGVMVQAPKDAGKGATIDTSKAGTTIPLPAGSTVTVTKESPLAATKDAPARPAKEVTTIAPAGPTEYHKTEETVKADTGTIDTSIRQHEIDAAETRPLLYASIVAALAAGFFVYRAYPTPAICCGAASAVFFIAWKVSGLPPWFWAIGLCGVAAGAALYIGHERGLNATTPAPSK